MNSPLRQSRLRAWFGVSDVSVILVLLCLAVLMFFPYLFWGRVNTGGEQMAGFYQYSLFYSHALATDQSFLWDPHEYGGSLTYINQFGDFLFLPVYFFFTIFPPFFAYYLVVTLAVFGGLTFAYLFGREFFLSRSAAFILALTYATAQSPTIFQSALSFPHSFLVLPLLLYALVKIKKAATSREVFLYGALGSLGMGVGVLAGNFVIFLYTLVFVVLFGLFLDFFGERFGYGRNWRSLLALLAMGLVGAVIGLPQLIALFDNAPFTSRTAGYGVESAGSHVVFADFLRLFFPYNFSFPIPGSSGFAYLYFGFLPLLFGVLALSFLATDSVVLFFFLAFLLFAALSLNLPGVSWINTHAPLFDHVGSLNKWLLVGAYPVSYLAGYGFDRFHSLAWTKGVQYFWKIARTISLGGILLLALLQIPLALLASSSAAQSFILTKILALSSRTLESLKYPLSYYLDAIQRLLNELHATFSFSNPHFVIFLALALGGIFTVEWLIREGSSPRTKGYILLVITAAFVALFLGDALTTSIPRGSYFTDPPPVAKAMLGRDADTSTYRFVTFEGEELGRHLQEASLPRGEAIKPLRELLLLDTGSAYNLETMGGHDPLRSMRQNQLIHTALSTSAELAIDLTAIENGAPIDHYVNTAILQKITPEEKAKDIEKRIPLLSMMNVKYLISLYPLTDSRLQKISTFSIPELHLDYALYENRTVLPRLYFAANPIFTERNERDLFIAMLETTDFSKKTYIECGDCATSLGEGSVSVTHTENGIEEARTTSATGGWLVYSASNLPGWIATVDGVRVPIKTANYLFQAIEVPKGEHVVKFHYVGSFALFLETLGFKQWE